MIFVDADQIVRTDMGELYDMDIKGRPLAYTPFCDNNKDMDGYRFWRQVNSFFERKKKEKSDLFVLDVPSCMHNSLSYFSPFNFCGLGFLERSFTRKTIPYQVGHCFYSLRY